MRVPLGNYRDTSISHFQLQKTREIFTLVVHNVNSEYSMQGARLVNKGGKIGKKRNNQISDQEYEKNCIFSERKGIRTVCGFAADAIRQ